MAAPPRRYLDHAATSWPKPPEVLAAWQHAATAVGATAGRAAYHEAVVAGGIRDRARAAAARLLGAADPARVALMGGCTLALNAALHGLAPAGSHVIATAADHNAVLRPLQARALRGEIAFTIVPCDALGRVDPAAVAAAWRPDTRLVAATHASNVTGALADVAGLAEVTHARGGLLLVDAAQTFGQLPIAVATLGADAMAAPTHKWLQGTPGVGLLWMRPGLEPEAFVAGGTGSASDSLEMPDAYCDRMEAGTPDVPALAALVAAVEWLEARGPAAVGAACRTLAADAAMRLESLAGCVVAASPDGAPIVSFTVEGYDPATIAVLLEQMAGLQVRSGHHCAATVHVHLATGAAGTVRASFGPANTTSDVDALVGAVAAILGG